MYFRLARPLYYFSSTVFLESIPYNNLINHRTMDFFFLFFLAVEVNSYCPSLLFGGGRGKGEGEERKIKASSYMKSSCINTQHWLREGDSKDTRNSKLKASCNRIYIRLVCEVAWRGCRSGHDTRPVHTP